MASTGITITINAESADAAAKLQNFFSNVTGKLNELSKAGDFMSDIGNKIVAAFSLGAIVLEFKHANEAAEEFGKAVQKTGLSFPTLNALKTMAQENRIAFEELTLGLTLFNDKIFAAVRMGGDSAKVFRDLKIAVTDSNGALRPTEDILRDVMDRFQQMPDGIEKTADAQELFGRSSRQWIPLLNEGSAALDKMKATGGGITPEMFENAERFNVAMVELKNSFEAIFLAASTKILPILQDYVGSLNQTAKSEDGVAKTSDFLVAGFKATVTVVEALWTGLKLLGEVIGNSLAKEWEDLAAGVKTAITLFKQWWDAIKNISTSLLDIAKAASHAGSILKDLATGNFAQAADEARKLAHRASEDIAGINQTAVGTLKSSLAETTKFFEESGIRLTAIANKTLDDFLREGLSFTGAIGSLWGDRAKKPSAAPAAAAAKPTAAGAPGAATADGQATPIVSEEGKKLIEEIEKQWREATQSKLALLDFDRDQTLKKLREEFDSAVTNEKVYNEERLKALQTYQAKRQQILDEQTDHENKRSLEGLKGQIDLVEKNPDLTESERKRELLPLLEQERELLQRILDLENQRAADPKRNQEEQTKAKDQAAALQREMLELQDQQARASQTPMQNVMKQLNQQNDLQKEVASSFQSVFNGAINSISSGITGLLMKTESWRQALLKIEMTIMTSIINAIVQMGVRWVMTQLMMALFGRGLAASSTAALAPIAAAQSAVWATPATLSAIASYGVSADMAPLFVDAAIAEVMASSIAFATGGLVNGPGDDTSDSILARLSRGEYVIPADRVRQYGANFMDNLRNGVSLAQAVPSSITRPITSDGDSFQQLQQQGAAGQRGPGAGNGGVTVQGHQVTFIQPANRQEMLDAMASSEGEKIWVQHGKKNKGKIGVGS